MVDRFDIFSKCYKVYHAGDPSEDKVIAISQKITNSLFSLSYADIAHYSELQHEGKHILSVVLSSRKESISQDNHDIQVNWNEGDHSIVLSYTKRRSLSELEMLSRGFYEMQIQ